MTSNHPTPQPRPVGFWDERYAAGDPFGLEPNDLVREAAPTLPPGPVLCLGEGQGRNALHLAALGHEVTAVDQSAVGLRRAAELAAERGLVLHTLVADLAELPVEPGAWAGVVSVFVHLPGAIRGPLHARVAAGLAPGGAFVLEQFAPGPGGTSAGSELADGEPADRETADKEPADDPLDRWPALSALLAELPGLVPEIARSGQRTLLEGPCHRGLRTTAQLVARRPR